MTPRKIRLSPADQKIAEELGHKLFYYETSTENHAAALRVDPTGYSQAYREYLTLSPAPMGTLPEPDDMDRCIREAEELLAKECITPLESVLCSSHAFPSPNAPIQPPLCRKRWCISRPRLHKETKRIPQ